MPLDELVGLGGVATSGTVRAACHVLAEGLRRARRCCVATAAATARSPNSRHASRPRTSRRRRCSPSRSPVVTPAATRRCSPSARAPRPAIGWRAVPRRPRLQLDRRVSRRGVRARQRGDRASRPLQRRGAVGRGARAAPSGERQPGDDARVAGTPRLPPPRAGQGPGASSRDPRGRGAPGDPVHDRGPRRHRRVATRPT